MEECADDATNWHGGTDTIQAENPPPNDKAKKMAESISLNHKSSYRKYTKS